MDTRTGEVMTLDEMGRRLMDKPQDRKYYKEVPEQSTRIKTGRNDMCPCGSGKKFKKCCLQ